MCIRDRKYGAEFVSPYHQKSITFQFANAWNKNFPYAYQVRRSDFDLVLLNNARAKGASVIEECKVGAVEFLADGGVRAEAQHDDGRRACDGLRARDGHVCTRPLPVVLRGDDETPPEADDSAAKETQ